MHQQSETKEAFLHDLQVEWEALLDSLAGLSETELQEANAVGAWSLKDLLGHITSWEDNTLQMVEEKLAGGDPNFYPYVVDEWNAAQVGRKRSIPLGDIQATFHETHRRLVDLTSQLPEEVFQEMTRVRIALEADAWGHYREHRGQIEAWRQARRRSP